MQKLILLAIAGLLSFVAFDSRAAEPEPTADPMSSLQDGNIVFKYGADSVPHYTLNRVGPEITRPRDVVTVDFLLDLLNNRVKAYCVSYRRTGGTWTAELNHVTPGAPDGFAEEADFQPYTRNNPDNEDGIWGLSCSPRFTMVSCMLTGNSKGTPKDLDVETRSFQGRETCASDNDEWKESIGMQATCCRWQLGKGQTP